MFRNPQISVNGPTGTGTTDHRHASKYGDGTEFVNVLGTLPVTGPNAEPKGFLRVAVERTE